MPKPVTRKRSASLGYLPSYATAIRNEKVKVKGHVTFQQKADGVVVDYEKPPPEEPTPKVEDDLPPNYDELKRQVTTLNKGKNLENWIRKTKIKLPAGVSLPAVKNKLREFERKFAKDETTSTQKVVPQYENLKTKLEELKNEKNFDKWLETLEHKPTNIPQIKDQMKEYFLLQENESNTNSRSGRRQARFAVLKPYPSNVNPTVLPIPGKYWSKFLELTPLQKTAIIVGITVIAAGIGILTWTIIGAAFPPVLMLAQGPLASFFAEFAFEMLRIRSEVQFNLLALTTEQAKPLSRAWRDQFYLYKYL